MANLFRISRPVGRRRRGTAHYLSPCTSSTRAWISSLYYQFLILSRQFHKIMSLLQFIEQWSVPEFLLHMAPIVFNKCKRTLTSFHHMFTMSNEGKLFPHTTLFPLNSNVWNKTKPQRGKKGDRNCEYRKEVPNGTMQFGKPICAAPLCPIWAATHVTWDWNICIRAYFTCALE